MNLTQALTVTSIVVPTVLLFVVMAVFISYMAVGIAQASTTKGGTVMAAVNPQLLTSGRLFDFMQQQVTGTGRGKRFHAGFLQRLSKGTTTRSGTYADADHFIDGILFVDKNRNNGINHAVAATVLAADPGTGTVSVPVAVMVTAVIGVGDSAKKKNGATYIGQAEEVLYDMA